MYKPVPTFRLTWVLSINQQRRKHSQVATKKQKTICQHTKKVPNTGFRWLSELDIYTFTFIAYPTPTLISFIPKRFRLIFLLMILICQTRSFVSDWGGGEDDFIPLCPLPPCISASMNTNTFKQFLHTKYFRNNAGYHGLYILFNDSFSFFSCNDLFKKECRRVK